MTDQQKTILNNIRSEYPLGTKIRINERDAVVTGHVLASRYGEDIAFVTITNAENGDWFNCDPKVWGILPQCTP